MLGGPEEDELGARSIAGIAHHRKQRECRAMETKGGSLGQVGDRRLLEVPCLYRIKGKTEEVEETK